MSEMTHFVVVRADLPLGAQLAQTIHAAGESASPRPTPGTIAVALHARDESDLKAIGERLSAAKIPHYPVVEDDGQLMAIGLEPTLDRASVRRVLSSVPAAKERR